MQRHPSSNQNNLKYFFLYRNLAPFLFLRSVSAEVSAVSAEVSAEVSAVSAEVSAVSAESCLQRFVSAANF